MPNKILIVTGDGVLFAGNDQQVTVTLGAPVLHFLGDLPSDSAAHGRQELGDVAECHADEDEVTTTGAKSAKDSKCATTSGWCDALP